MLNNTLALRKGMCLQCELRMFRTLQRVDALFTENREWLDDGFYSKKERVINREIYPLVQTPSFLQLSTISWRNGNNYFEDASGTQKSIDYFLWKYFLRNEKKEVEKEINLCFNRKELDATIKNDVRFIRERLFGGKRVEEILLDERRVSFHRLRRNPRAFRKLIFDLCKELFYDSVQIQKCLTTSSEYNKKILDSEASHEELQDETSKRALNLLSKPSSESKVAKSAKELLDVILVQELHVEETEWTTYRQEETDVKNRLADSVFNMLIDDTVQFLSSMRPRTINQ